MGEGWIEAKDLRLTDQLITKSGEIKDIDVISKKSTTGTRIYNISVTDNHNYFVGDEEVLTHNLNCEKFGNVLKASKKINADELLSISKKNKKR